MCDSSTVDTKIQQQQQFATIILNVFWPQQHHFSLVCGRAESLNKLPSALKWPQITRAILECIFQVYNTSLPV